MTPVKRVLIFQDKVDVTILKKSNFIHVRKSTKKWINIAKAILGLSIIGMLIVNQSAFVHSHKLPDGTVITHAHPFNKNDSGPFKEHGHSAAIFLLLDNLQLFPFVAIFMLGLVVFQFIGLIRQNCIYKSSCYYRNTLSPRAPPA